MSETLRLLDTPCDNCNGKGYCDPSGRGYPKLWCSQCEGGTKVMAAMVESLTARVKDLEDTLRGARASDRVARQDVVAAREETYTAEKERDALAERVKELEKEAAEMWRSGHLCPNQDDWKQGDRDFCMACREVNPYRTGEEILKEKK